MNNFLRLLLSLSLSGAVLTAAAALLNRFLKGRIPHVFRYYLWLLVLLRFVCPFGTEYSLANQAFAPPTVFLVEGAEARPIEAGDKRLEPGGTGTESEGDRVVVRVTPALASALLLVWALGAAAVLGVRLSGYFRLRKRLAEESLAVESWERELYQSLIGEKRRNPCLLRSAETNTPMLAGVFRPRLYLPPARMGARDLRYALCHELVHWRRKDLLYKWALVLIAGVHWFNPAVWYLIRAVERDCELSCDEAVVWGLPQAERAGYGAMLLETAACQSRASGLLLAPLWSKKHNLKERLYGIMKPTVNTKKAKCLLAAAVVLVTTTSVALGAYAGQMAGLNADPADADVPQPVAASSEDLAAGLVAALAAEEELSWPFEIDGDIVLSALYGERVHPITGETSNHTGIDIPLEQGTPVLAAGSGQVIMAEYCTTDSGLTIDGMTLDGLGNCVVISHGTTITVYGNLKEMNVSEGETVSAGQQIGTAGMTGAATGPHLHFEVYVDGSHVDPLDYLPKAAVYAAGSGQAEAGD